MSYTVRFLLSFLVICSSQMLNAQLVNLNNVHVQVSVGAHIKVNGDVQVLDSTLYNLGNIDVNGSLINNGIIYGGDYAQEHGVFNISKDWINNGQFYHGLGLVNLNGNSQNITGTQNSVFYNLSVEHKSVKTLLKDVDVKHHLLLNDAELALNDKTLNIHFIDLNAIQRTTGYISTDQGGIIIRNMLIPEEYVFPLGSSQSGVGYVPLSLQPFIANKQDTNQFALTLMSHNPTNDGYNVSSLDTMMCFMNDVYYYAVNHIKGSEKADVIIDYPQKQDSYDWNKIVHWTTNPNQYWENTEKNGYEEAFLPGNNRVRTLEGWDDFAPNYFGLAYLKPRIDDLAYANEACMGKDITTITVNDTTPFATYQWNIDGGQIINSRKNQVDVVWNRVGEGTVEVHADIEGSCISNELEGIVQVRPQPTAGFVTDTNNVYEFEVIHFIDTAINLANVNRYWNFADGATSIENNPFHKYEHFGRYPVSFIVNNEYGCADTATKEITIRSGVIVPNVMTPNSDGVNDYFVIKNSGMEDFSLQIYNRWGAVVFVSENPHAGWDGRTMAGLEAPTGTYYYLYKGTILEETYEGQGAFSLIRE